MAHTTESLITHAGNGRLRTARHFRRAVVGTLIAAFTAASLSLPAIAYAVVPEDALAENAVAESGGANESATLADELVAAGDQQDDGTSNFVTGGGFCQGGR